MGRSSAREQYFNKHISPVVGYRAYLKALAASPYKQHRTAAKSLTSIAEDMEQATEQAVNETEHLRSLKRQQET